MSNPQWQVSLQYNAPRTIKTGRELEELASACGHTSTTELSSNMIASRREVTSLCEKLKGWKGSAQGRKLNDKGLLNMLNIGLY